jgi:leucyl/phenylalanyl-tRNA--protein transferase
MSILHFPPVNTAGPEGLLAIGGDLDVASLVLAYRSGVFPWPTEGLPLLWFAPPTRGILDFKDLKIPKRFRRELKGKKFSYAIDQNFPKVIRYCAEGRTRVSYGTWITREMEEAYLRLHRAGYAHSFECYSPKQELIGGLYGVGVGGMFAGESMFYHASGASKAALLFAVDYLRSRGAKWMDIQMLSPLLRNFGGKEILRREFMKKLRTALKKPALF